MNEDIKTTSVTSSSVFIVNCEYISLLVLIVDFERAKFPGFILKRQIDDKIEYIMRYFVVF